MTIINFKKSCIGLMLFFIASLAHAQSQLVAQDDSFGIPFGIPFGQPLVAACSQSE